MNDLPTTLEGFKLALEFMGNQLKELKDEFKDFKQHYVPISDYLELKELVKGHATKIESLNDYKNLTTGKVAGIYATSLLVAGLVSFLISNFFNK